MSKKPSGIENIDLLKNGETPTSPKAEAEIQTAPEAQKETTDTEIQTAPEAQKETTSEEVQKESDNKDVLTSTIGYEKVIGVVCDCESLNVRCEPNTDCAVVGIIRAESEVIVYEDLSTDDFYKVCTTAGAEGYCSKQYITIK